MDLTTFNDHLDQLGPDLDNWPADLRAQGKQLLAASPEAADALADAHTIKNLLKAMEEVPAPGYLAGRISANVETDDPWQRLLDWFAGAIWRPVLAAGLPLAFGFVMGAIGATGMLQAPLATDDADLAAELGLLAFSASFEEVRYEE